MLASLGSPKEIKALAEANELPHRTAHQAVEVLKDKGVVTSHKEGRERVVTTASNALSGLAPALLFDIPREDWDRILHGDRPMQLHVLDRVGHPELTAEVYGKGRNTLYRTVEFLGPAGALVKRDKGWRIKPCLR
jgi:DNA-binding transcriptional ArsR family regulator